MVTYYDGNGKVNEFLETLSLFHEQRNHDRILELLKIEVDCGNIKNNKLKYVSVKSNNDTKRMLSTIRYVIPESSLTLWIKYILEDWMKEINNNQDNDFRYYELDETLNRVVNFNVDEYLWNLFVLKCKASDLTISNGFKCSVYNYLNSVI